MNMKIMEMKGCFTISKSPGLQSHHQIQSSVRVLPLWIGYMMRIVNPTGRGAILWVIVQEGLLKERVIFVLRWTNSFTSDVLLDFLRFHTNVLLRQPYVNHLFELIHEFVYFYVLRTPGSYRSWGSVIVCFPRDYCVGGVSAEGV